MTIQTNQARSVARSGQPDSLADVLERVLDKGIVIAGDIVVNVLDIELLTLKIRLFVASAQTAQEMGMDWWTRDPFFTSRPVEDGRSDRGSAELESQPRGVESQNGHREERR